MNDLISRQEVKEILRTEWDKMFPVELDPYLLYLFHAMEKIENIPSAEPWSAIRTMLNELERKQEKLYADYCDVTARLKAINKIAESDQTPNRKIDGIKPLAELEVTE